MTKYSTRISALPAALQAQCSVLTDETPEAMAELVLGALEAQAQAQAEAQAAKAQAQRASAAAVEVYGKWDTTSEYGPDMATVLLRTGNVTQYADPRAWLAALQNPAPLLSWLADSRCRWERPKAPRPARKGSDGPGESMEDFQARVQRQRREGADAARLVAEQLGVRLLDMTGEALRSPGNVA